ncbi:hypothetical protein INS49_006852 [Diaporthe citri]|uniref:uncharacterized protein n=1 Tax=Diaporthe citri TaxID=83186 RepID=UPI001C7FE02B|nr:uncharacterized protein INS49_006852 [Diaporthe citri]KAG6365243.1 hypothetical protein INS49_006852 [Diaporthe citri]
MLDKLVGIAMLVAATVVFLYYTFWTFPSSTRTTPSRTSFPLASGPSVSPVILILLASAVVGSFLGVVMIRSNKKKAAKAKAAAAKKKT